MNWLFFDTSDSNLVFAFQLFEFDPYLFLKGKNVKVVKKNSEKCGNNQKTLKKLHFLKISLFLIFSDDVSYVVSYVIDYIRRFHAVADLILILLSVDRSQRGVVTYWLGIELCHILPRCRSITFFSLFVSTLQHH